MGNAIVSLIGGLFKPLSDAYRANQERKAAHDAAKAKLAAKKVDNDYKVELTDQEWEALSKKGENGTWKDEYITVSIVSIINLIVLGGIMAAFGEERVLQGMGIAITALVNAGVDLPFIFNAVVLAGIGLKIWRR
jgi:hypothetical protein